jgi:uncharacterized membrane protein YidH (DUF202 family)
LARPSGIISVMDSFTTFMTKVETQIIDPAINVLALLAFILFAYGVFEFIRGADNEEKRKTGQQHLIWAIVGLVILFGAHTIVQILTKVASTSL